MVDVEAWLQNNASLGVCLGPLFNDWIDALGAIGLGSLRHVLQGVGYKKESRFGSKAWSLYIITAFTVTVVDCIRG